MVAEEYRHSYGKLLNPPVLNNVDEIDSWLDDLQIRECVTDIGKKQQGPVIYLSLSDKVRSACSDIAVADLNKDDGLNILINKLETYVKDKKASTYIAYDRFETFQRPSDMNITDYLNEFERLYHEIQRFKMSLLSVVLAYRVLKSSNLSNEKQQLARATLTDLTYEIMKKQLKAIEDNSSIQLENSFQIKSEPSYLAETKK